MALSTQAQETYTLVRTLQKRFADKLDIVSSKLGEGKKFKEVTWLRDNGLHGGGSRYESRDTSLFNAASINVSQVHYDENPEKSLKSATAISTIIHPKNPNVPSIHIHISLTELRDSSSYWRIMADLNPSIAKSQDTDTFSNSLKSLSASLYDEGSLQGDKYFNIPALKRTRGVSHFYLENYATENKAADFKLAKEFGEGIIDTYVDIINAAFKTRPGISSKDKKEQLDYHTLYLFQVLTLDRGTTSGLLVHSQNDVGIMGSLPTHVDRELLASWSDKVESPQNELVNDLANSINEKGEIDVDTKLKLASVIREHYKKYPQALDLQASGNTIPSTVSNHSKP
ncbi:coproporphyrinogen III oxidase [Sulfurimonas sp.]|uniref:coproporphyrinogen III oxidase n=1 Tax=Sulfurimonas sp. TaxID=2022749 RepID=UPI0025EB5EC9|nr:coproporphyrinogen III oxidase [Sulfurimonas sp.]